MVRSGRGRIIDREDDLRADPAQREHLEMVDGYAREMVRTGGAVDNALTIEMQRHFTPTEFADLVFAIGYHIGMQHVGRATLPAECGPSWADVPAVALRIVGRCGASGPDAIAMD